MTNNASARVVPNFTRYAVLNKRSPAIRSIINRARPTPPELAEILSAHRSDTLESAAQIALVIGQGASDTDLSGPELGEMIATAILKLEDVDG